MSYSLPRQIVSETFIHFRKCGVGRRECQVLWLSSWTSPAVISEVVHPEHEAHFAGFRLDDRWLSSFWLRLARENLGVRVQVHTHPGAAFHSAIDDEFPIIHTPGFLSLVIPNFALGPVGFENAYLTEIRADGCWQEIPASERLFIQ